MPGIVPRKKIIRSADKVHVVARIRPFIPSEGGASAGPPALTYDLPTNSVEGMTFDSVFDHRAPNGEVFQTLVSTVDAWIQGYNGCVFAYGQTSSGKTHTMLGPDGGKGNLDGMIPMAVTYALREIRLEEETNSKVSSMASQFRIQASYIEVYNNDLRDLLGTGDVQVRENSSGDVFVEGATLVTITSAEDCLRVIRQGSTRRATGRTNMNEHSSRSHAIFALHMQHRWKDETCDARSFKMKTSVLNLVDLAGSEYAKKTGNSGDKLKESIAINTGLFCLGNVIAALAGHRDRRCGDHIPYRDSVLTRLLQGSLGGDSRTVMIVCCSPALDNKEESLGSLRYAHSARAITNRPAIRIEDLVEEPQPLDNDIADVDAALDRRTLWLDTSGFGDVYCRCVGNENDPLLLYVHGSGPTNSSTWWNGLIWDVTVRSPTAYYHVAIDCPGYGRSPGDRQTIRSLPGQFLMSVIRSLGKTGAHALIGSSQGACAVFNATLEIPTITNHVVVMDPVGHDVMRYKAIKQPCLLIFDIEDDGHPVKVGRWMRDNLLSNVYHEFAGSKDPYWHVDNMAVEMIKLFEAPGKRKSYSTVESVCRLAGGLCAWAEHGGYGEPIKQIQSRLLQPPSTIMSEILPDERWLPQISLSSSDITEVIGTQWRVEKDEKSGRIFYICDETLEVVWKRPKNGVILGLTTDTDSTKGDDLFAEKVAEAKPQQESEADKQARLAAEKQEIVCSNCDQPLWRPRRKKICRHVFCFECYYKVLQYNCPCSVCKATGEFTDDDAEHQSYLATVPSCIAREREYQSRVAKKENSMSLVFEYGNTSSPAGGSAYTVQAYLRCIKAEKGSKCKRAIEPKRCISRVEFNINPDFPKSAVKVTASPYVLDRTMASAFPCDMTIYFEDSYKIPPITLPYTIHHVPHCRNIAVVVLPSDPEQQVNTIPKHKKPTPVRLDNLEENMEFFM
eukprot:PhF_6_TR31482/c0_g1_i1/m.46283/K10395/KIF4_21_27; kinesin family member 4/21/27